MASFSRYISLLLLFSLFFVNFVLSAFSPAPSPSLHLPIPADQISAPPTAASSAPSPASSFSSPPAPPPSDLAPNSPSPAPTPSKHGKEYPSPAPAAAGDINHEQPNASNLETEEKSSSAMSSGQKAGVAIGVIAGACIVGAGVLVYKKRQQNIQRSQYGYAARREIL